MNQTPVTGLNGRWNRILLSVFLIGVCLGCRQPKELLPSPPPPRVTVARPIAYPVQIYWEYNGNLDAVEVVQIVARVEGFLDEIAFTEGDEVQSGDLLFKIDPRVYAAGVKRAVADKRKADAELKLAKSEEVRVKGLRPSGAVSEEDYQQRIAARETGEATVMQADAAIEAAKLQLGFTEIRSPIDGQISRALVTRGNLVGQNERTLLTTIVSMDPLFVYFDVPEKDLVAYQRSMKEGQEKDLLNGLIPVEIGVSSEEGYPHIGQIDFRENRVDTGTGTVRLRGRIPNPKVMPGGARLLYPGLYARIRVPSGAPQSLLALPEDALMTGQEGRFVYVVGEKNVIEKRSVTVGPQIFKGAPAQSHESAQSDEPRWRLTAKASDSQSKDEDKKTEVQVPAVIAIVQGLSQDDVVVVNGLTKARPGFPVEPNQLELLPPASPALSAP